MALILMAKAPLPGSVKTRLCPPLAPRSAASLYASMLTDVAEEMGNRLRGVRRYLYFSPPEEERRFLSPPFRRFERVAQRGRNLGERMGRAIRTSLKCGARHAVVIGADCPSLSASRVRTAFRDLSGSADLVLGPSQDGGFYLIGASFPVPFLFRGIRWGTDSVLAEVILRCRRVGLSYSILPVESDVDRPKDLETLLHPAGLRTTVSCPQTRRWLRWFASTSAGRAFSASGKGSAFSQGRD